jgi:hypothetical protein
VNISSQSFMWSLRFWFFFGTPLYCLYSWTVFPKVALLISLVSIAKPVSSFTPLSFHSSVSSCLIAIPLSLLSIQSFG